MPPVAISRLIKAGSRYSVLPDIAAVRISAPLITPKNRVSSKIKRIAKRDILFPIKRHVYFTLQIKPAKRNNKSCRRY